MSSRRSYTPSQDQARSFGPPVVSSSRPAASSRRGSFSSQRSQGAAAPSIMPSSRRGQSSSSPNVSNGPPMADFRTQDGDPLYTKAQMQAEIDRQCRPYRIEMDVLSEDYRRSQEALEASEGRVEDRDEALKRTRDRLTDADLRLDEMEAKLDTKGTELLRAHESLADTNRQLRDAQREVDEMVSGEAHALMEARLTEVKRLRVETEQENVTLKAQITQIRSQQEVTQRQQIAQMKAYFEQQAQQKKSDAETEGAQLKLQIAQMKESYEQQAKDKKTAADTEIAGLKLQISNLRAGSLKEMGALRAEHSKQMAAKNKQITDVSAALGKEQALRSNDTREHQQQLIRLNEQLRTAMDQRNAAQQGLPRATLDPEAKAALHQDLEVEFREIVDRKTERKVSDAERRVELKWEKKVKALEKEIASLQGKVEELQADLVVAGAEKTLADARITSLEVKLRNATRELSDNPPAKRVKVKAEE